MGEVAIMRASRVEAFTDAVIAILITIMVLELPRPDGPDLAALRADVPELLVYLLSFLYLGIAWNNHHHMFQASSRVDGRVLLANMNLLFWLSLVPFTTSWMNDESYAEVPVISYGIVLLAAAIAFTILQTTLIRADGPASRLKSAVGRNLKGVVTLVGYVVGIVVAFFAPLVAVGVYAVVVLIWLVPDPRIENRLRGSEG